MDEAIRSTARLLADRDFDDVLLVCHSNPDGDTLGSAYALRRGLELLGKRCWVRYEEGYDAAFDFLTRDLKAPDAPVRRIVTVDVADLSLVKGGLDRDPDLAVDHHKNNRVPAAYKLCLPDRAACGEIVFELLTELGVPMERDIARALYTAIATDTGRFCYQNTTSRTFRIAAMLCDAVPEGGFADINDLVFETRSPRQMKIEAFAVNSMLMLRNGSVAALGLTDAQMRELGNPERDFSEVINVLRRVEGVKVAVFVRERDGAAKVSLRAKPGFDCARLCERFAGGGHAGAAGCTLQCGVPEALERITEAIIEVMDEQRSHSSQ